MFKRRSKKSPVSITDAVEEIRSELKRWNTFLEEADTVEYEEPVLRNHVNRVKDVTVNMQDVLDDYGVAVEHQHVPKERGLEKIIRRLWCRYSKDPFSSMISKIDDIKAEIRNINKAAKSQGITERIKQVLEEDNQRKLRSNINHELEDVYIEITDDIEEVIEMLTIPDGDDPFVSIFGEAGSGKTTIAKKVYEREEVRKCFECFAWIDIIQEPEADGEIVLLQDLVKMLMEEGASSEQLSNTATTDSHTFQFLLEHNKCLIVLDGVRSYYDLRFLLRNVPRAKKSMSKVLITTRVRRVAEIGQFLVPRYWTETESWDLLYKISIIDTSDAETDLETKRRMEHIGRQIVSKCDMLPLAVATIGGILRTTPSSLSEWEKVLAGIHMYLRVGGGSLEDSFAPKYNSLPLRIKPCFLYMALFQKDEPIEATRLCHLWIAEGLVSKEDCLSDETLMDVAQRNLLQLASWDMIEVVRKNEANKDVEWCKLHPLVKDVLHKKAKKEGFF